jgi:hydroxyacylglutathione hydrolase
VQRDDVRQLADSVYFVRGEGDGRFPSCHGFLLSGKETVLIDAGIGEAKIREIDREKHIDILMISHSHPDHIRYWHLLHDRYILLPQQTPDVVQDLQLLGERFTGSSEGGTIWADFVRDRLGVRPLREPDGRYAEGDVLEIGGAELEAIHTPGHLDDHYCFLERKTGTLFATDIDLTSFGPWYGNPESDIEMFEDSVKKVMAMPCNRVCSSHKEPIEGRAATEFEAFLKAFCRQSRQVLELCDRPSSLEDLVEASPFYGNGLPNKSIQQIFEGNMISKNLALLVREGRLQESNGRYRKVDGA